MMFHYLRAAYRLVGSRQFGLTLMISWTLLIVVWVIPFIFYGLPAEQINRIVTGELFFRLTYAAVLIATAACLAARVPSVLRRTAHVPSQGARPRPTGQPQLVLTGEWRASDVTHALQSVGARRQVVGQHWAWGVKNRIAPLGTLMFHTAFFLILGAAFWAMQPQAQFDAKTAVTVGERFDSKAPQAFTDQITPGVDPPQVTMTLQSVEPRFFEDILLFTKLEARVGDEDGSSHRVALGAPWLVTPTTMVSIEDFGYSVEAELASREGTSTGPKVYRLKVFPSEMEDSFKVVNDVAEYRVDVRVFGDYVDRGGKPGSASFNASDPRLLVSVSRVLTTGGALPIIDKQLVALGESVTVEGAELKFISLPYHAVFRVTRQSAAPLALAGVVLLSIGVLLRLAFPRIEILAVDDGDGAISVFVRDLTYRRSPALERRLATAWEARQ